MKLTPFFHKLQPSPSVWASTWTRLILGSTDVNRKISVVTKCFSTCRAQIKGKFETHGGGKILLDCSGDALRGSSASQHPAAVFLWLLLAWAPKTPVNSSTGSSLLHLCMETDLGEYANRMNPKASAASALQVQLFKSIIHNESGHYEINNENIS